MSLTSTLQQQQTSRGAKKPQLSKDTHQDKIPTAKGKPSRQEIWAWTLTRDAIAACFVRDVFEMRNPPETFGFLDAEFFWLGRIPCRNVRIVGLVVGIQVYEKRIVYTIDDGTAVVDCTHRPLVPPQKHVAPPVSSKNERELEISLKPIASVGATVWVEGKVVPRYDSRQVVADQIGRCRSVNEEFDHWKLVQTLHKSSYSLQEEFIIPETNPPKELTVNLPSVSSTSTISHTPVSDAATSVPTIPLSNISSRSQKLRHPTRLRSADLNGNTFRIYVKHYMDHAPSSSMLEFPLTETNQGIHSITEPLASYPHPARGSLGGKSSDPVDSTNSVSEVFGFTVSYLRRVPELSILARRVAEAEAKRRAKQDRISNTALSNTASRRKHNPMDRSHLAQRMKRLFEWAIVQLLQNGGIVIWDGPSRPHMDSGANRSSLWKLDSTLDSTISSADSTIFSTPDTGTQIDEDDTADVLSEPEEGEESYMPVTPAFLATYVEQSIRELTMEPSSSTGQKGGADMRRSTKSSVTTTAILARLQKDDRWRSIGSWNVDEALDLLKKEARAWCVGGAWELSI
ncbi:hypothetical protein BD779DRAFT_1439017 [Infundibulicybe gibba]|nr:hypothetical protein BD779DRAFT_1439017 [Infundibulicybe gibba]